MEIARELVIVVPRVHVIREHELLRVVHAQRALSLGFRLCQIRQEQDQQNRDDRDDNKELDQGESLIPVTTVENWNLHGPCSSEERMGCTTLDGRRARGKTATGRAGKSTAVPHPGLTRSGNIESGGRRGQTG